MSRSRAFCLTQFGDDVLPPTTLDPKLRYWAGQLELCPDTKRKHLQFTLEYKTLKTLKQVREDFPGCHVEVRIAKADKAIFYCTDPSKRMPDTECKTLGDLPKGQGARSDLAGLQVALDAGTSSSQIATDFFATYLRYNRGIEKYQALKVPKRYLPSKSSRGDPPILLRGSARPFAPRFWSLSIKPTNPSEWLSFR